MGPPPTLSGRARERPMTTVPLAHAGHWYQAMLYLAPVLIVVVVLWVQERRERGRDESGEDDGAVEGTDP
jgi:cyanate permease